VSVSGHLIPSLARPSAVRLHDLRLDSTILSFVYSFYSLCLHFRSSCRHPHHHHAHHCHHHCCVYRPAVDQQDFGLSKCNLHSSFFTLLRGNSPNRPIERERERQIKNAFQLQLICSKHIQMRATKEHVRKSLVKATANKNWSKFELIRLHCLNPL
jgi:hypothetical protein